MYTATMTTSELERLYYSVGLPDIAALYATIEDQRANVQQYEEQVNAMFTEADYKLLEAEKDALAKKLETAGEVIDALYKSLEDGKRCIKASILKTLESIDTEVPG